MDVQDVSEVKQDSAAQRVQGLLDNYKLGGNVSQISRDGLTQALLEKHRKELARMDIELKAARNDSKDLEKECRLQEGQREEFNNQVQKRKQERNTLRDRIRELKREFFNAVDSVEDTSPQEKQVMAHKNNINELEWNLMTEGVSHDDEKHAMVEIRKAFAALREVSSKIEEREELEAKLDSLIIDIQGILTSAQDAHSQMLKLVRSAEEAHNLLVDARRKLSGAERARRVLPDKIKMRREIVSYWQGRTAGKNDPQKHAKKKGGSKGNKTKQDSSRNVKKTGENKGKKNKDYAEPKGGRTDNEKKKENKPEPKGTKPDEKKEKENKPEPKDTKPNEIKGKQAKPKGGKPDELEGEQSGLKDDKTGENAGVKKEAQVGAKSGEPDEKKENKPEPKGTKPDEKKISGQHKKENRAEPKNGKLAEGVKEQAELNSTKPDEKKKAENKAEPKDGDADKKLGGESA